MISKEYDKFILTCNDCGDEEEFETFDEALIGIKELGWKTIKDGDNYEHYCDECKGDL